MANPNAYRSPTSGFSLNRKSMLNPQDDAPNARSEIFRHSLRSRRKITLPMVSLLDVGDS